MSDSKTKFPIIKWAQRKDKLFITIMVVHSKKPIVDLTDGKRIKYQGTDGNTNYAFDLELYDEIVKEESKYTLDSRNIFLNLKKKTSGPYWPRLNKDEKNNEDNGKKIEKKDVGTNTENYNENDFAMLGENKADISDLDKEEE